MKISGHLVDIHSKRVYKAIITVLNGRIENIEEAETAENVYILPGFIDSHIHIESSMIVPSEFAKMAVRHGTVSTVSDPHEIANVLGVKGVEYMIDNASKVPFKFNFGVPSCVPATIFETAGAEINAEQTEYLLQKPEIKYLAEMMNWPGVLNEDPVVMEKLSIAKKLGKKIDGHAPGLKGNDAYAYAKTGISTDHECFSLEEAHDKLKAGMKILIREGSAAKNFDTLIPLLRDFEDEIMFCSDDKHPDSLAEGHINDLVKRALEMDYDLFSVLKAACLNPVIHYGLDVGTLKLNDPADFILVDNLKDFNILQTYIDGQKVYDEGDILINSVKIEEINNFNTEPVIEEDLKLPDNQIDFKVIKALDGQLITDAFTISRTSSTNTQLPDLEKDILKIVVKNRYSKSIPSVALIYGFGLKFGAIASSVAHDSHNIVAVGTNDRDICRAINEVISNKGGISAVSGNEIKSLSLPIAGLMSAESGDWVAEQYIKLDQYAKELGATLSAPFMTLSFMALLVIPKLKISDKGLFDAEKFEFV